MRNTDFCVFILTHKRPDRVTTYNTLKRAGYTGPLFLVVDDEDPTLADYQRKYLGKVLTFSKQQLWQQFDMGDNRPSRATVTYARNACFDLARQQGFRYFVQLDDDYQQLLWKTDHQLNYVEKKIKDIEAVFDIMLDYYKSIPAASIAMAQNGDYIGGKRAGIAASTRPLRKAMNSFFCDTERQFQFVSRMNDDVTTYVTHTRRGALFLTVPMLSVQQKQTQANSGGLTDMYLESGTYQKSFYTVMYEPSCTVVAEMGDAHRRLHHRISWPNCAPLILPEWCRKAARDNHSA